MNPRRRAIGFIVSLGIVSLFADVTYEGARSLSGPFLATLGASGAAVGFIAGMGELIGYGLRYVSGWIADRSRRYWTIVFAGYSVNLIAVPLLALAPTWQWAAILMMVERFGKGIRAPARDALLSHAAMHTGVGWGFGLHEALDQIGAFTGPLLVAGILASRGSYPAAFAMLTIPAACALVSLAVGRLSYPTPPELPSASEEGGVPLPGVFRVYCAGSALLAFGYADFALIAFHWKRTGMLADAWLPVSYAAAMAVDAIAALALGRWFDRNPRRALLAGAGVAVLSAPLAFLGSLPVAMTGLVLWGAGMGAQESVLRAMVARLAPASRRASAFGIFHGINGVSWFAGSALLGVLYDSPAVALSIFSVAAQVGAFVVFQRARFPDTMTI